MTRLTRDRERERETVIMTKRERERKRVKGILIANAMPFDTVTIQLKRNTY